MGESSRAAFRRGIFPILHTRWLITPTSSPTLPKYKALQHVHTTNQPPMPTNYTFMNKQHAMTSLPPRLPSKNTAIWTSSMTTQSPRRSPYCRLNSPSSNPTKTRRIWNHPHHPITQPHHHKPVLPHYYFINLRHHHNQLNLPSTSRSKITNRLLISKPYGPGNYSRLNPNAMKPNRGHYLNDRPRPNLANTILPGKYKLRANP